MLLRASLPILRPWECVSDNSKSKWTRPGSVKVCALHFTILWLLRDAMTRYVFFFSPKTIEEILVQQSQNERESYDVHIKPRIISKMRQVPYKHTRCSGTVEGKVNNVCDSSVCFTVTISRNGLFSPNRFPIETKLHPHAPVNRIHDTFSFSPRQCCNVCQPKFQYDFCPLKRTQNLFPLTH